MSIFDAMRSGGQPGQPLEPSSVGPPQDSMQAGFAGSGGPQGGLSVSPPPMPLPSEMYENPTVDAGVLFPDPDAMGGQNPFMGPQMGRPPMGASPGMGGSPASQDLKAQLQQVLLQKAQARMQASQQFQQNAMDTSQVQPNGGAPTQGSSGY